MAIVFEGKMNVFEAPVAVVTCTVNTVGVMGAGVAKEYKARFPETFAQYQSWCRRGFRVGQLALQKLNNGQRGLLFPTKVHWKNPSEIEYVEVGLQKLLATYKEKGIQSLAITPLGCANGKLSYEKDVRPLMLKYLNQMDIPVYICL